MYKSRVIKRLLNMARPGAALVLAARVCVGVRVCACVRVRRDEDIRDEELGRGHST